ncbi:histidine kinase [Hyphomicrobium nitrativorans NL23]|uniref:histidine kinase n=1 Tax=Hyphomicrobium nitrativorans NL23 TaxID=1029756 RepID=V5SBH2_9HYPH|nr:MULTISPECIES: chemotaxis protein CheB [Hyphomicrobium]AHB47873.1 histidine kinase [Hyphomicrobium nitrativorans NL23]HRN89013.1 chemotaxis protein CheB [Hyphomicrobium sp.]HRQ27579.1 chemotaxis protein CheB [Hyphomicrobium sp.]
MAGLRPGAPDAAQEPREQREPKSTDPCRSLPFAVVGLGASAGGLDAFQRFLDAVSPDSGMAFVLIQHLDPTHVSMMSELLARHTKMPVVEAANGMPVEVDHVYLIPPGAYLALRNGSLWLSKPHDRHGARMPLDFFLCSIAHECGERALCAILSGTGTDGSLGLKAVHEQGGLVVVQDPHEAQHDGMPRSAIDTGCTDFILPIAKVPQALISFSRQAYVSGRKAPGDEMESESGPTEIIALLTEMTSHDFSLYKPGTLTRRIERRMALAAIENRERYLEILREDIGERERLARDLLINVTQFFRDRLAFDMLGQSVVPELVQEQPPGQAIRVWVPACSSGEEAYSIAILFLEAIAASRSNIKLQVFASDIEPGCVAFARNGSYPEHIHNDVTPERLSRYFIKEDGGYRVVRELREAVVFTTQNLLADPPFSRLDLISCRNVLIYLSPEAQERTLSLFHFALRERGVLVLGASETVGKHVDHFAPISKTHRLYRHIGRSRPGETAFPIPSGELGFRSRSLSPKERANPAPTLGDLAKRTLMDAYVPAAVLINDKREALHYFGAIDIFLKIAPGEASRDILVMAREGLRGKLRHALQHTPSDRGNSFVTGGRVTHDGRPMDVTIGVFEISSDGQKYRIVSFAEDAGSSAAAQGGETEPRPNINQEQEIALLREELNSTILELEVANEEHKAINEEAMSVNEEFQSINEELETSKEELQSLNEELNALNSQLQETVERQRATADDLNNILNSSDVATLFLDRALRIRFFTPATKTLFNIITTDIGRPLGDLTHRFRDDDMLRDATSVLKTSAPKRREIEADDGSWYIRSILPYRSDASHVDGVVVTFTGISEIKAAQAEIQSARSYSDSIIATIGQPLVVLDADLRVISASTSFYRVFAVGPAETVGRPLHEVGSCLDVPALRQFLATLRKGDAGLDDAEITITLPALGIRSFKVSARTIGDEPAARRKILLSIIDVTDTKRESEALAAAKAAAERANIGKSRFLAAASHDLRQPLQTINLLQGILMKRATDEGTRKLLGRLDDTTGAMSTMLDKLLDINQLEAGIVRPEIVDFPINSLLSRMKADFSFLAAEKSLRWSVIPCSLFGRSDPRLLDQMIRNLVSNAFKYTSSGKLLLGCRRRPGIIRIEVLDTGIGLPMDQARKIFEEFHQLDNPARDSSLGLGLGLSIVKRLGDLLGHSIDVRSIPGYGSAFAIEIPLAASGGTREARSVEPARDNHSPVYGAVLVIEDDPSVREMLKLLLDQEGYRTTAAADVATALELAGKATTRPDLIVADYNLARGVSGLDAIASLRQRLQRDIPAIVVTGDISAGTLRAIADHGYTQLNKPVKAPQLVRLIQDLLQPSPTERTVSLPQNPQGSNAPTVYVVDDDAALREASRDLLQAHGYAVEAFADGEEFLRCGGAKGCLLLDARLPGMTGLELIERLKTAGRSLATIMITGDGDVPLAVEAMKAGAVDFIEKPIGHVELLASIERALDGNSDEIESTVVRSKAVSLVASLTARQRQILELVMAGHPSKNIAADLGISQRTVDNHRAAIMKKTGSKSMPALIRIAIAAG